MKKTGFIFIVMAFMISFACRSQTYVKGNALYWAVGIPNVSAETSLSERWSLNGDAVYSPWESVSGNPMKFVQLIAEVRCYPRGTFNGFYAGAYAATHVFKLTKWNYLNLGAYQKGYGIALGASVGYVLPIGKRWNLDLFAGYGWHLSSYRGYREEGGTYVGKNRSGEWLPYKLGVSVAYRIFE